MKHRFGKVLAFLLAGALCLSMVPSAFAASGIKVTLNANKGTVSPKSITVVKGKKYGTLPTPTRKSYHFLGWYTKASGGSKVTKNTTVTNGKAHTLYAHWMLTANYNAHLAYNKALRTYNDGVGLFGTVRTGVLRSGRCREYKMKDLNKDGVDELIISPEYGATQREVLTYKGGKIVSLLGAQQLLKIKPSTGLIVTRYEGADWGCTEFYKINTSSAKLLAEQDWYIDYSNNRVKKYSYQVNGNAVSKTTYDTYAAKLLKGATKLPAWSKLCAGDFMFTQNKKVVDYNHYDYAKNSMEFVFNGAGTSYSVYLGKLVNGNWYDQGVKIGSGTYSHTATKITFSYTISKTSSYPTAVNKKTYYYRYVDGGNGDSYYSSYGGTLYLYKSSTDYQNKKYCNKLTIGYAN